MNTYQLPLQQTTEKDEDWQEESVDAIIDYAVDDYHNDRYERIRYRDMYDGILYESYYADVTKPFGKEQKNMPDIKNYNIIKPLVDVLAGEKVKRPISYMVVSANDDAVSNFEEEKFKQFKKYVYQEFIKEYQAVKEGKEGVKEPPTFEQFEREFAQTYRDERTIRGQHALNYLKYSEDLNYKLKRVFKNFLVEGVVVVHVDVRDEDIYIDFPDVINVYFDPDNEIEFIEDGSWSCIKRYTSWSRIVRSYGKELREKYGDDVIDELQRTHGSYTQTENYGRYSQTHSDTDSPHEGDGYDDYDEHSGSIEYFEVYWRSLKQVGIVTGTEPTTGNYYKKEVDYPYKKQKWEEVEWDWDEQVWKGVRIVRDYYVDMKPVPVQRKYLTKRGTKLPVNGRVYADNYNRPISLVSIAEPYQVMFNIYMYRLERLIAKSRDMIAVFDINFIPEDKFESFDEWFYWIDKTGMAFVDYNKEGYRGNPQHQSYIDLTAKSAEQYISMMRFILESLWSFTGINKPRQGDVGQYSTKGTTERAVIQSSHITEDYFFKFKEFEKRFLQSCLDYSKAAWLDGKKLHYMGEDNKAEFYELDGLKHLESEYNIHVSNDADDEKDLEMLKELSQAMIQNGMKVSTVAEIMRSKNFAKLRDKIVETEQQQEERQQQMQQLEQQIKQEQNKAKQAEINLKQRELDIKEKDINTEANIKEKELEETIRSNKADEQIKKEEIIKDNSDNE